MDYGAAKFLLGVSAVLFVGLMLYGHAGGEHPAVWFLGCGAIGFLWLMAYCLTSRGMPEE